MSNNNHEQVDFAFLSFCPMLTFSQEVYEPFIVDGKVWYYDFKSTNAFSD